MADSRRKSSVTAALHSLGGLFRGEKPGIAMMAAQAEEESATSHCDAPAEQAVERNRSKSLMLASGLSRSTSLIPGVSAPANKRTSILAGIRKGSLFHRGEEEMEPSGGRRGTMFRLITGGMDRRVSHFAQIGKAPFAFAMRKSSAEVMDTHEGEVQRNSSVDSSSRKRNSAAHRKSSISGRKSNDSFGRHSRYSNPDEPKGFKGGGLNAAERRRSTLKKKLSVLGSMEEGLMPEDFESTANQQKRAELKKLPVIKHEVRRRIMADLFRPILGPLHPSLQVDRLWRSREQLRFIDYQDYHLSVYCFLTHVC